MINERYKISKKLGQGRSAVYLCTDSEYPDKEIALKILSAGATPEEIQSFNNEFFILRKLSHPGIISAFDLGTIVKSTSEDEDEDEDVLLGSRFFTMEYFNGKELKDYEGKKDETELEEIIKQICSVLFYLHQSNYIYYDLKLENILIAIENGKPVIKLIDLGFAQFIPDSVEITARGTAEYIAPELLKNEEFDHRVDLYSLGMLLYRNVYDKFPFETNKELEIYKSHIEKEFDFPSSEYSDDLINVIKKLLKKDPASRYNNSLEILEDLKMPIDEDLTKDWFPASVFSNRKDVLTIVNTYLQDKDSGEVFSLRGSEGAGKTALIDELYANLPNSILINEDKSKKGVEFVKLFLKRIVYNQFVYPKLSEHVKTKIDKLIDEIPDNLIDELKSFFNEYASGTNLVLLLDGFSFYDEYTLEVFKNIFPILQVNKIKIIISENADTSIKSNTLNNLRGVNIAPFTDVELDEFVERSFFKDFPNEDLKKIILLYADLLPGSILSFIKDAILLKIIQFHPDEIKIRADEKTEKILKSSHEEIYQLRLDSLRREEHEVAEIISAFETAQDTKNISVLFNKPIDDVNYIFINLQNKNIIQKLDLTSVPVFTTEGLKGFVYNKIDNKKEFHLKLVRSIREKIPNFNRLEFSRQLELAGEFKESYLVLKPELEEAERISAYSYQRKILLHLTEIPLEENYKIEVKYDLCKVLFKMSDFNSSLRLIEDLSNVINDEDRIFELSSMKGSCLIGIGKLEVGKDYLNSIIKAVRDEGKKLGLLIEIINSEFQLNRFDDASKLCLEIIENKKVSAADKGKCLNYLGLIEINKDNNLNGALLHFEKAEKIYEAAGLRLRVAQMQMNMGNIYNIKGDYGMAESYWNKSLEVNQSIGNLDQKAKLLLNFGALNFYKFKFEKAIEFYQRASSIFLSLGNNTGNGLVLTNLGEIYLIICEYEKAVKLLHEAKDIFGVMHNYNEYLESLFILCKTYFAIGDYNSLDRLLTDFKKTINNESINEKHKNNFEFLKFLRHFHENIVVDKAEKLINFRNEYLKLEDRYNYFDSTVLVIKNYLKAKEFDKANKEISGEDLISFCKENDYFEAERLYLSGLLAEVQKDSKLKQPIDYYLNAYEIVKNLEITEVTWKVLYATTVYYASRGNIGKAEEFLIYAKSVIDYLTDKLIDPRLKMVYLDETERHAALETLNLIAEQT